MHGIGDRALVLIIDEILLRRKGSASVFESWGQKENLQICPIAPAEMDLFAVRQSEIRLIIFGVGGASLKDPPIADTAARIAALFPGKKCCAISDRAEPEEAILAAHLAMQGFISSSMDAAAAAQVFTFVLGGGTYFPREALIQAAAGPAKPMRPAEEGDPSGLTPRQIEVLEELGHGKSNKLIARHLRMRESTVKVHVRQIMRKLGASNRTQAALRANKIADVPLPHQTSAAAADQSLDRQKVMA